MKCHKPRCTGIGKIDANIKTVMVTVAKPIKLGLNVGRQLITLEMPDAYMKIRMSVSEWSVQCRSYNNCDCRCRPTLILTWISVSDGKTVQCWVSELPYSWYFFFKSAMIRYNNKVKAWVVVQETHLHLTYISCFIAVILALTHGNVFWWSPLVWTSVSTHILHNIESFYISSMLTTFQTITISGFICFIFLSVMYWIS